MKDARCSRLWQAEAVLDRRLAAADRVAFERHAQTCQECARERAELARLHELGERMPSLEVTTPLARRRQRNELLRRAHEVSISRAVASRRPSEWRRTWLVLPSLAVLMALGAWWGLGRGRPIGAPAFETVAAPNTRWRAQEPGPKTRISLNDGSLRVAVQKLEPGQSFVITLPDGELEVRGTRFVVNVKTPRTERVAVTEGLVALRIRGQHELLLRAGDTWVAPAVASAVAAPPTAVATLPTAVAAPPAAVAAAPALSSVPTLKAAPHVAKPLTALPSAAPSSTHRFGEAMAAYTRGDFATAERLFQSFELASPHSSQVEDSLFLRAMSRQRRGDREGAKQLAAEYVRRYPAGFRAAEARRLLTPP